MMIDKLINYLDSLLSPNWHYCSRHNHWWTDRSDVDHGVSTGFNRGEKDRDKI
jgi:hypothetical protein